MRRTTRRRACAVPGLVLAILATGACDVQTGGAANPGATEAPRSSAAVIRENESGPANPLVYGLTVPRGATQLGPIARWRSDRVIDAFAPELAAAATAQGVEAAVESTDDNPEGVAASTPPTTAPSSRPARDSFAVLTDPPSADVTAAVIRIDGDPTVAVTSMAAQVADLLPDTDLVPADLGSYCTITDRRVQGCALDVTGTTEAGIPLRVRLDVDPGNTETRTAPPAARQRPVMQILVENLADPTAPVDPSGDDPDLSDEVTGDVPDVIWPAMDLDAKASTPLLGAWTRPAGGTILLSSFTPGFVSLYLDRGREAAVVARQFATSGLSGTAAIGAATTMVRSDIVEELNEVDTTFRSTQPDGSTRIATHVVTARGHYVMMFVLPPGVAPGAVGSGSVGSVAEPTPAG